MDNPHTPEPPSDKPYPPQTARFYLELSVYWFALSFLWAGMITIVIQTLVEQMAGARKDLLLGWTLGVGALVSTVAVLIAGALSDRSRFRMGKRRPFIVIGTLLAVPPLLWMGHVRTLPALFAAFCLVQWWVNLGTSPYQALVPDLVPRRKQGTASAFLGMGSLLGQMGGLVLCSALIARPGGVALIMRALAAMLVAAMAYTVWRIPESPPAPAGARLSLGATLVDAFRVSPRAYPDFFRLVVSRFAINVGFYTATTFMLYYVTDTLRAPNPTRAVTVLFLVSTVAALAGNFPAGILSDRISKKAVLYASAALTAAGALVFLFTSAMPVALGAAVFFGAGFGAFAAVDWALATNLLPERDEAKYMGVWHIAFNAPQVVAPLIGGGVAYYFNAHPPAFAGPGFGYRAVLLLVVVYFAIGVALVRPIREHPGV
jgi:MFS family permease